MEASSAGVVVLACYGCALGLVVPLAMPLLLVLPVLLLTRAPAYGAETQWARRCIVCSYSLEGLPNAAHCPECGRHEAGRISVPPSRDLVVAPTRVSAVGAVLALLLPGLWYNASAPLWELLYRIEWGRVPIEVRGGTTLGAIALTVLAVLILALSLRPHRDRGVVLTAALTAAGFWSAQPIGVMLDWQADGIQPGGAGLTLAPPVGAVLGFVAGRALTARWAMLKLRRIRSSRDERSSESHASPPSPAAAPPTTRSPSPAPSAST